jgi:hypothetical protein
MNTCGSCGTTTSLPDCPLCEAPIYAIDAQNFPPVTWGEVREHLVTRLFMDTEWLTDSDESLTWWPWFLPQRIYVADSGVWQSDHEDNFLHLVARTQIAEVDEDLGLELCRIGNDEFALGAFVWDEGVLSVVSSLSLNPLCRGLLDWFHEAALAQVTAAHLVAQNLVDDDRVRLLFSAHPQSGFREQPDELLSIFAGESRANDPADHPGYDDALAAARVVYQRRLEARGWQPGFRNEEVDFFAAERVEVAIGRTDDAPEAIRYGRGLVVWVRLTPPGILIDDASINNVHLALVEQPLTTLMGRLLRHETAPEGGTQLHCYLPSGFLAASRGQADILAVNIMNAVTHCAGGLGQFLNEVERIRQGD